MNEDLYIQDTRQVFDALVIGSGITGGWAAKEFCERGLNTLMIERGRVVKHREDYPGENKRPWELPNRTRVDLKLREEQYRVQSRSYAFHDANKHFFGNDTDLPYTTEEGTDFNWIRANQLGGRSLIWHRQSYRMNPWDFEANKADNVGNDWPIRYEDLQDWYPQIEKFVGISGHDDKLEQLPSSEFLPPFDFTKPEQDLQARFAELYPDRPMVMSRAAHLTESTELHLSQGRVQCQARAECQKGCSFGAYFSTQSATLPAAAATGNLSIAPNSVVHSLIYDEDKNRVIGVRVIDNDDLSTREYFAKVVFLCASTLGSTQIMLNSTSQKFPNGIANSSGALGHYLMDHNYNAGAVGYFEGYEDEYYSGRRPTGICIPNFQYKPEFYKDNYIRGYGFTGGSDREDWRSMSREEGFGADFKDSLTQAGRWKMTLIAHGEMLPRYENQVSLHATNKDKWGIPQLHINCQWSENEIRMMEDAAETAETMLREAGLKDIGTWMTVHDVAPGLGHHEIGTARMGRDPRDSVLNGYNQSHDIPNLFVTDGSAFCSSGVANPSLTFMALTVRAVDYAVKEMNNGRI